MRVCLPGLRRAGFRRWILVGNATSIGLAYEAGRRAAETEFQAYVHDDTELLVDGAAAIIEDFLETQPPGTLAGALGSTSVTRLPWWSGDGLVGRVNLSSTDGVEEVTEPTHAGLLDGVVLVQRQPWSWTPAFGWHTYDALRSLEARSRGAPVWVHPVLECEHHARYKGIAYHRAHQAACRRLALRFGVESAYDKQEDLTDGDSPS